MNNVFGSENMNALIIKQAASSIVECNKFSERWGLTLSYEDALQLVKIRNSALINTGRIEFSGGSINKLISYFYDSPYIQQENYADTLAELTRLFYYYKNEFPDNLTDNELLILMRDFFNGSAHGSLYLLGSRELLNMADDLRRGRVRKEELFAAYRSGDDAGSDQRDEVDREAMEFRQAFWKDYEDDE